MEPLPEIADFEIISCLGYGARSTIYAVSEKATKQVYALKRVIRKSADYARFLIAEARHRGVELRLGPDGIADCASADYPTPAKRPLNSRLDTAKLRAPFGLDLPDWESDARRWVEHAVEVGIGRARASSSPAARARGSGRRRSRSQSNCCRSMTSR